MTRPMERADLTEWSVESYRATVFVEPVQAPPQPGLWERLVGEPPAAIQQQPRAGFLIEQGMFGPAVLTVQDQPGRIDLLLTSNPEIAPELPVLGAYPVLDQEFKQLSGMLLHELSGRVTRIALGVVMFLPSADGLEGYARLAPYLSRYVKLDVDGLAREFLYRINRPRRSKVNGEAYTINRLSQWSVVVTYRFRLQIQPVDGAAEVLQIQPVDGAAEVQEFSAATRLELDMSTDATRKIAIPPEHLAPLFAELSEQAVEIAREGDMP